MDPKEFEFKDKEIERVTAEISKEGKREFGASFKEAKIKAGDDLLVEPATPMAPATQVDASAAATDAPQSAPTNAAIDDASKLTDEQKEFYEIAKPLRTYERDIAETIRNKNESVMSINLAASAKKNVDIKEGRAEAVQKTDQVAQKSLVFLISLILIFAGVGISIFVYFFYAKEDAPTVIVSNGIISVDAKQELDVTGKDDATILTDIAHAFETPAQINGLTSFEIFEKVAAKKNISAERIIAIIAPKAPSSFGRSLDLEYIFGFHKSETVEPFLFLKVDSYDNAFAGMLRWEADMANDLGKIFIKEPAPVSMQAPAIVSDASSTPNMSTTTIIIPTINAKFEDKIVRNKDTRVLKDSTGKIVLLYSFLDQKNLVITTNEKTFQEILSRFFSSQVVR